MSATTPRKQKQKDPKSHPTQSGAERFKTVVRRLPPNLPEEIFWQSVQAWVTDDTVTWKSYHPGKLRTKRLNKEGIPSRAYIAFKREAHLLTFSRSYDGHVFRDKAGNESHAIVEYAPFQKVPTEKKKVDARNNTIDKDDDYLSFLETLKGGTKTESLSLDALIAAAQPPPPPTTTPLLEALKAEKSALKDKETILRNHAHYKDPGVTGLPVSAASASTKKEEGLKKKTATTPVHAAAAKSDAAGKKGKKQASTVVAHKATSQERLGQSVGGAAAGTPPSSGMRSSSGGRQRPPPKEPHGRAQVGKGEASAAPAAAPVIMSAAIEPTSASAPPGGHPPSQRKHRPVVGLGRQLESALSGAGVTVLPASSAGPTERKRRDKGGEPDAALGVTESASGGGGSKPEKQKQREARAQPSEVVPSILQRPPETGADTQWPQSPRGIVDGSAGHGEGGPGGSFGGGRGNARRGRRGRGGHRGG